MFNFLEKIFGSKQDRDIKPILPIVEEIKKLYEEYGSLSDDELRQKTVELKNQVRESTQEIKDQIQSDKTKLDDISLPLEEVYSIKDNLEELNTKLYEAYDDILDEILPEAFAIVKDTCRRLTEDSSIEWDMIPYDVQLIGGVMLHHGKVSEMATGEGKTLVASLPVFLNALTGEGVHIITVNDYLAKRDREWMGPIYDFHGLTSDVVLNDLSPEQRKQAYSVDITYGTNNEFGFDYLRDNMETEPENVVHRNFFYAIVDEVDSVLIDEARTPLIISGAAPESSTIKFEDLKPSIERLVRLQQSLTSKLVSTAEDLLKSEEKDSKSDAAIGLALLRAKRGQPKNKRLIKLLGMGQNMRNMESVESDYLRDNASRMHEVDDELYFAIDEKFHSIDLTEKGRQELSKFYNEEDFFLIPDVGSEIALIENNESLDQSEKIKAKEKLYKIFAERTDRIHNVSQMLKAYSLYERDVEYVVQNHRVLIVDEFTGRVLPGRRYSDGLHQAIEAKESVKVEGETQTMATVTLQNYFRLYKKLAGMTGTAETEESEFHDIYKLDVTVIPTNKPNIRIDEEDLVYKTKREKYNAVIKEIEERKEKGQPILVGTTSVESSETLSRMLKRKNIQHNVLNAKQHDREAEIIKNAGLSGSVTIATNMAGRGTDIKLGEGVKEKGGLFIIGTERHESRRIDRQLRGRSGRQGDPGDSQFYLSLEDDLMRLFGSDRISKIMDRLQHEEGEALQHPLITKSIERAQRKVEEQNFATRKRLLEYDNVMNQQREIIYGMRKNALFKDRLYFEISDYLHNYSRALEKNFSDSLDAQSLSETIAKDLGVPFSFNNEELGNLDENGLAEKVYDVAIEFYKKKEENLGADMMSKIEKFAVLGTIDLKWREHLRDMDNIKEGIHLRAYGQKDPLIEYKQEAFQTFSQMLSDIEQQILETAFKIHPTVSEEEETQTKKAVGLKASHETPATAYVSAAASQADQQEPQKQQPIRVEKKLGRNDKCHCGSGKKYKNCHGR